MMAWIIQKSFGFFIFAVALPGTSHWMWHKVDECPPEISEMFKSAETISEFYNDSFLCNFYLFLRK